MFEWCLEKGKTERKHRGIRIIEPDNEKTKEHLKKALHNLNFMKDVAKLGKYQDWIFPSAFYAMYHACLAILYYFGFESRNQECTFVIMEKLINERKIGLDMNYVNSLRNIGKSVETTDIRDLREEFQYGAKVKAEQEIIDNTLNIAEKFVLKTKGILMSLMGEL